MYSLQVPLRSKTLALTVRRMGVQVCLSVETALRETMPGSVLHVAASVKTLEIAKLDEDGGIQHAAAARLCRLAMLSRYGEVDDALFERLVEAYTDMVVSLW